MRRLTAVAVACLLPVSAGLALATPALAQPSPTAPPTEEEPDEPEIFVPEPVPGEPQCSIADPRLNQLSGLVAVDDGYYVINDGSGEQGVFVLDQACQVIEQLFYANPGSRDPEDLELDRANNILWVGDTGDNQAAGTAAGEPRETVALWRTELNGDRIPTVHRFVYEDGQPRDAEALILDGDGVPVIVTKEIGGTAELFKPVDLVPNNPAEQAVTLERVGEFTPPDTGSDHDVFPSAVARRTVTGGGTAPDFETVVLRTYTDAFEFDVVDGEVVAAISEGQPRVTPLPGEPQGEAITYTPDGTQFLTVSEIPEEQTDFLPVILRYEPGPPPPEPEPDETEEAAAAPEGRGFSLINDVQDIINLVAVVGVIGLLLVAAGIVGIVRSRRRAAQADEDEAGAADDDPDAGTPATARVRPGSSRDSAAVGGAAVGGAAVGGAAAGAAGVYGAGARGDAPPERGEYGGAEYGHGEYRADERTGSPPGTQYGGTQYGGAQYGGAQYGEAQYGEAQYGEAQYGGAEYGEAQYGGTQYGGAEYGGDGYDQGYEPGYGGTQYGGTQYGGTQYGGTQYGGTQYGGTQYGGSEYGGAQYGEAQYGGAEYGGAQYGGAEYGGTQYGGSEYGGAQYGGGEQAGHHGEQGYPEGYGDAGHAGHPHYDQGYQDWPGEQADGYGYGVQEGGAYRGGSHQPHTPDYYSDDPDYPYEFRDPNRW